MKVQSLRKKLSVSIMVLGAVCAVQANAAPVFSFTEYGGFTAGQVAVADYSNPVVGDATVVPGVGPLFGTMSWNAGGSPQSSLVLTTQTGPSPLAADTWTTISSLTHNNLVIPNAADWGPQDIWGRLVITDSDGGDAVALDSDDVINVSLTETINRLPCAYPTPVGTTCDDFFTFSTEGFGDLQFTANDGSEWLATFRFANLVNAVQDGNVIYTGERLSSSLDIQVLISAINTPNPIPEPATLGILGLGLLGFGFAKRHKKPV